MTNEQMIKAIFIEMKRTCSYPNMKEEDIKITQIQKQHVFFDVLMFGKHKIDHTVERTPTGRIRKKSAVQA